MANWILSEELFSCLYTDLSEEVKERKFIALRQQFLSPRVNESSTKLDFQAVSLFLGADKRPRILKVVVVVQFFFFFFFFFSNRLKWGKCYIVGHSGVSIHSEGT